MLKGKGISEGIGIGKAFVLKKEKLKIEESKIEDVNKELEKLDASLNSVIKETESAIEQLRKTSSDEQIQILEAYLMFLKDETLMEKAKELIKNNKTNSVYAVKKGLGEIANNFRNISDNYLSERANDIEDIKNRIISKLLKIEENSFLNIGPNTILVTQELTTSDTAKINMSNVAGIISEIGGTNSHVSIIARNKQIPMVIRIENAQTKIKSGDNLIVNGNTGVVYVEPPQEEIEKYKKLKLENDESKKKLEEYKNIIAKTKDGIQVEVSCNIGKLRDLEDALRVGADGIGLFRTEFLFMDSEQLPTEEEQFESYKKIGEVMKDKLSIIRTLDVGGDKNIPYLNLEKEDNPFLGYRSIRLCLKNKKMFQAQLRAILRASHYGNLAIMFPMIASVKELVDAKKVVEDVKNELREKIIPFNENIEIGIMIEIPSAAIMADELAKECDFFSIGTNDLIQYTLAVERGNEKVASLYTHFHPAVIRLIKYVIDSAHNNGIICGMCGEAAGDSLYVPLLVGMGLDDFSMNANKILESRKLVRSLNYSECKALADEVLKMVHREEIKEKLNKFRK